MLRKGLMPVWVGILVLSGMFLLGQNTWPPPGPTITEVVPAEGHFGDPVAISRTNFGTDQGANTVAFNGGNAGVALSWSPETILINVPIGATSGPVVVTVGGLASNGFPFTVWPDCVEDADCDDGNVCTDDTCDPALGCLYECTATGPTDLCCADPACAGEKGCEVTGGTALIPAACFLMEDHFNEGSGNEHPVHG